MVSAGSHERFNQEPIQRFRRSLGEIQSGEIDFSIPSFEEAEVGFKTGREGRRECCASAFRASREPLLEFATRHEFADIRPRNTPSTATAAGVTPGIRDA